MVIDLWVVGLVRHVQVTTKHVFVGIQVRVWRIILLKLHTFFILTFS